MAKTIKTRIQNKHDIAANWERAVNFIPLAGEIIIYDDHYFDESGTKVVVADAVKYKVGDGVLQADGSTVIGTKLNDLPFVNVNAQSDWSQNDDTKDDYVKNRPFYEEYKLSPDTVYYSSKKSLPASYLDSNITPDINTYSYSFVAEEDVTWPENTILRLQEYGWYPVDGYSNNIDYGLINEYDVLMSGSSYAPRLFWWTVEEGAEIVRHSGWYVYNPLATSSSIQDSGTFVSAVIIPGGYKTEIKTLDEKYIPDTIARVEEVDRKLSNISVDSLGVNIENGTGSSAIQQRPDNCADGFSFTGKNENASELFNTYKESLSSGDRANINKYLPGNDLEATIPYGAIGAFSSSSGGKSAAFGKRASAEGTTTIAFGKYSHVEGDNSVTFGNDSHAEGYQTVTVGLGSHAEGSTTIAIGNYSHAEGYSTVTEGSDSHAEGSSTVAIGSSAHAEGYDTIAENFASHSEGESTKAGGRGAHAEGYNTSAAGDYSHVEGYQNSVDSNKNIPSYGAHAEGYSTSAKHDGAHAEGYETVANNTAAHAEGIKTVASGYGAHAEGRETVASNEYSHAEGDNTTASGAGSHAEGRSTTASGGYSHAEGSSTHAIGNHAHAEGEESVASGLHSHAEGYQTLASGCEAHAGGTGAQAIGNYSFAHGNSVVASKANQFVVGKFNSNKEDTLFEVGNGLSASDQSNAFEVLADGRAKVYKAPQVAEDVLRKVELDDLTAKLNGRVTEVTFNITKENTLVNFRNGLLGMTKVNWGDDTIDSLTQHTYKNTGEYTCKIYDLTEIAFSYFGPPEADFDRTSLTKCLIGDSVTSISGSAFSNCSNLTSITIPDSVTSIGDRAFEYCSSLTSVAIGDSVTSIGESAFYGCSSLTSIEIPDGVTTIGEGAFWDCRNLTSVVIGDSVTSIGDAAFYNCKSLTSVVIGDSVTSIGNSAFAGCSSLKSVVIGDGVTSIGEGAFLSCNNLASVTLYSDKLNLKDNEFNGCYNLDTITLYTDASVLSFMSSHYGPEEGQKTYIRWLPYDLSRVTLKVPSRYYDDYATKIAQANPTTQYDLVAFDHEAMMSDLAPVAKSGLFEDLIIDWQNIEMVFDGGDAGSDSPIALVGTTPLQ